MKRRGPAPLICPPRMKEASNESARWPLGVDSAMTSLTVLPTRRAVWYMEGVARTACIRSDDDLERSSSRLTTACVVARLPAASSRSEEHTSELQSRPHLVCRLLLEKKKKTKNTKITHKRTNSCTQKN